MKTEDRAQLETIDRVYASWRSGDRPDAAQRLMHQDIPQLRRIIDEQAAEIARLEWPCPGEDDKPLPEDAAINAAFPTRSGSHQEYQEAMRLVGARRSKGGLVALVNWLLLRLAEERAKREAAENLFYRTHGVHHSWVAGYEQERERANRAERELAEERAAHAKADAARVNLRDKLDTLAAHSNGRAEKAEARVKELENVLHHYAFAPEVPGGTPLEQVPECLSRRVAELQALVGAATKFTFDNVAVIRIAGPASSWWVCPPNKPHEVIDTRDEAIALARELGKKEPTR